MTREDLINIRIQDTKDIYHSYKKCQRDAQQWASHILGQADLIYSSSKLPQKPMTLWESLSDEERIPWIQASIEADLKRFNV